MLARQLLVLRRLPRRPPPRHLTVPLRQLFEPNPCYLLPAACALRLRGPRTASHQLRPVPPHPLLPPRFLLSRTLRLLPKQPTLLQLRGPRNYPPHAARAPRSVLHALRLLLLMH